MKYVSTLLPVLKDSHDSNEARKSTLDLLKKINDIDSAQVTTQSDLDTLEAASLLPNQGIFGEYPTNYSEFESDGTLAFHGDATVWNDMIAPSLGLRVGGTAPTFAALTGGIYGYRFDAGSSQSLHGAFEFMHDYEEGTDLDFHVHWCPTTTNTGNIVWGVEYSIANIGSALSAPATVPMTPAAAPGVVNQHMLNDIVTISGTGLKIGAIIAFRIYRQNGGTDTFTGNAFLLSVGVHYRCDTAGSRYELSK